MVIPDVESVNIMMAIGANTRFVFFLLHCRGVEIRFNSSFPANFPPVFFTSG